MHIMICGASGLIGSALVAALASEHKLTLIGRDMDRLVKQFPQVSCVLTWQDLSKEHIQDQQVIINLAGENIGEKRWSEAQKKKIIESRVSATKKLSALCAELGAASPRFINASAIGIYGDAFNTVDKPAAQEDAIIQNCNANFLSEVATAWENALLPAQEAGVRIVIVRFGVVLAKEGGALAKMLPSFKMGLGAQIGNGQQPFSWVTIEDVVGALCFLMASPTAQGAYNIVADEVVTQQCFADKLALQLKRPRWFVLPNYSIHLLFGEMGKALLSEGVNASNRKLKALGFKFTHPTLDSALGNILT